MALSWRTSIAAMSLFLGGSTLGPAQATASAPRETTPSPRAPPAAQAVATPLEPPPAPTDAQRSPTRAPSPDLGVQRLQDAVQRAYVLMDRQNLDRAESVLQRVLRQSEPRPATRRLRNEVVHRLVDVRIMRYEHRHAPLDLVTAMQIIRQYLAEYRRVFPNNPTTTAEYRELAAREAELRESLWPREIVSGSQHYRARARRAYLDDHPPLKRRWVAGRVLSIASGPLIGSGVTMAYLGGTLGETPRAFFAGGIAVAVAGVVALPTGLALYLLARRQAADHVEQTFEPQPPPPFGRPEPVRGPRPLGLRPTWWIGPLGVRF